MRVIRYTELQGVRDAMARLDNNVKAHVVATIERVGTSDLDALRAAIMDEIAPVCENAAVVASEMAQGVFNSWRYAALGLTMDTVEPEGVWDAGKFDAAANTAVKAARDGSPLEQVCNIITQRSGYDNRRAYGQTLIENVRADSAKPRYARVPGPSAHYGAGCPFCRMLASRGFTYHSKRSAGEFDHYHADCTCTVVVSWDRSPTVEGYDPSDY